MKICGIYCIENKINNKKYIGQSEDIYKRFYIHKTVLNKGNHCNRYLQSAWKKYGESNFEFRILERDIDIVDRNQREIELIFEYETFTNKDKGYNLSIGGEELPNNWGRVHTEETKKNMSLAHLGKKSSEETKKKMGLAKTGQKYMLGKKHSEETKKKMSLAAVGFTGRKHTEETKEKIRLAKLGNQNRKGYKKGLDGKIHKEIVNAE